MPLQQAAHQSRKAGSVREIRASGAQINLAKPSSYCVRNNNRRPPPVGRRHRQPGLTAVAGLARNPVQKKRPAGDRLAVVIGVRQTHEQAPPVVDQANQAGHVLAALQILRREAAPAPLVLQLVEAVLRVRTVPIELRHRQHLQIERGRQNRELPDARARLRVCPEQIALAVIAPRQRHRPGKPPAQHNHATRTAPALQAKRGLDPRPALARVLPLVARHQALSKAAGSLRQTQLEQIVETRPLARRQPPQLEERGALALGLA